MGIRGKLLLLAVGIAVPLVVFGALDLRNMWRLSRAQLDDSIKQQVEFASVVLERWLEDQKRASDVIAALAGDNDTRSPAIRENLENVVRTRPFCFDRPSGFQRCASLTPWRWSDRTMDEERPNSGYCCTYRGGAVIARIDGAAINELFDRIELSQQVVISVRDSEGHIVYRRRGSEAPTEADVNWAPLTSALSSERTRVVELISSVAGVKRVYGIAHIRDTGLIAMIGTPSSTIYEPARERPSLSS